MSRQVVGNQAGFEFFMKQTIEFNKSALKNIFLLKLDTFSITMSKNKHSAPSMIRK